MWSNNHPFRTHPVGVHGPPGVPTEKKPNTCELGQLTGVNRYLVGFVSLRPEGVADGGGQGMLLASSEAENIADPTHHPMVGSDSIWWLGSVVEKTLSKCTEFQNLVPSTRAPELHESIT